MQLRSLSMVWLALSSACTRDALDAGPSEASEALNSQASGGMAVLVGEEGLTTIVFTHNQDVKALQSLVDESPETGFDWVTLSFPSEMEHQLFQPSGLRADFSDKTAGVTFRQGYRGPCNPAKQDLSACWLVEHVTAGESGASGTIGLALVDGAVIGGWDITIERITDKFGEPSQWHRYSTSSSVNSPMMKSEAK